MCVYVDRVIEKGRQREKRKKGSEIGGPCLLARLSLSLSSLWLRKSLRLKMIGETILLLSLCKLLLLCKERKRKKIKILS